MSKIVSISNQKGGVGKTTTCVNLAACLASFGHKVLVVDFDPQGNASSGLGCSPESIQTTVYEVLLNQAEIKSAILRTDFDNLYLLPSNVHLSGAEVELVDVRERHNALNHALKKTADDYEFILVDCPPSLGLLTINVLAASHSVMIPLQCEYYAMEGMSQLLQTIRQIQASFNPGLSIEGILATMYDSRNNISKMVLDELKIHFKDYVYETLIPRNVRLSEAPSYGKPIDRYDPKSKGAEAYRNLSLEFIRQNRKG